EVGECEPESQLERDGHQREDRDVGDRSAELPVPEDAQVVVETQESNSRCKRRIGGERRDQAEDGGEAKPPAQQDRQRRKEEDTVAAGQSHLARHHAMRKGRGQAATGGYAKAPMFGGMCWGSAALPCLSGAITSDLVAFRVGWLTIDGH